MPARFIRYTAVVMILVGCGLVAFHDPTPESGLQTFAWVVPIGYFTAVIGAAVLCWGWFKGRRI